jgi:hypothetical protein
MQKLPIYLYQNILNVILDRDATVKGVNQVMYQRDLIIQKGIKNQVRIQFKNSDEKRISISTASTYVFSMFDAIDQRLLIEKPLQVLPETTSTRGVAVLTLTESETVDLDRTSYQYSVKMLDSDGSYMPAYTNTYYGAAGTLRLNQDTYPVLQPSVSITALTKAFNLGISLYEHTTGNIYAQPEFNGNTALHTIAFYLTAYRGTIIVEGTLENTPGSGISYAIISSTPYTGFSGIDYQNFNGVYSYIRVRHIPAKAPAGIDNDDPSYYGKVDKILYRS